MKYEDKRKQEELDRQRFNQNTERLAAIIRPLSTAKYECDCDWVRIDQFFSRWGEDYGGFEDNPDFQRGHVWTPEQQLHYVENCLRGVVSTAGFVIQVNCPNWEDDRPSDNPRGFQIIDGLQRLTAVRAFLTGDIRPFDMTVDDFQYSSFAIKTKFRFRVAVHTFTTRKDLLSHYLALNTGGTPHSTSEIERVKKLLAAA